MPETYSKPHHQHAAGQDQADPEHAGQRKSLGARAEDAVVIQQQAHQELRGDDQGEGPGHAAQIRGVCYGRYDEVTN